MTSPQDHTPKPDVRIRAQANVAVDPRTGLATSRLVLRLLSLGDALSTSKLMTAAVSRWLASWPTPFTEEMAGNRIQELRDLAFRGDALPFAITAKQDGELLGWVSVIRDQQVQGLASLSFWLGEAHHGKGYMREIAPLLVATSFKGLGVDAIEAGAQVANAGSFAVMKACGMTLIGERMVYASARGRDELCCFYEVRRPPLLA